MMPKSRSSPVRSLTSLGLDPHNRLSRHSGPKLTNRPVEDHSSLHQRFNDLRQSARGTLSHTVHIDGLVGTGSRGDFLLGSPQIGASEGDRQPAPS